MHVLLLLLPLLLLMLLGLRQCLTARVVSVRCCPGVMVRGSGCAGQPSGPNTQGRRTMTSRPNVSTMTAHSFLVRDMATWPSKA